MIFKIFKSDVATEPQQTTSTRKTDTTLVKQENGKYVELQGDDE